MTDKEIIRMAREAGFFNTGTEFQYFSCTTTSIKRFAALVAEAEREACAELCLETEPFYGQMFAEAIRARGNK